MAIGHLENLQEQRVMRTIRELLEEEEFAQLCTCHDCFIDIAAISLNLLPPEYVADKFYKFPDSAKVSQRKKDLAEQAVRQAIAKVVKNPHHE